MKKPKTHFSKAEGAVYVAKDSPGFFNYIWPASGGLKKEKGCVMFFRVGRSTCRRLLSNKECNSAYGDHPARGEAWLVKPDGKYWLWRDVTNEIEYSGS